MIQGTTEERFEAAARKLYERWSTFDFVRKVDSGDPIPRVWEGGDEGVSAIKRRLHAEGDDEALLDLAASNRLDLTTEFLVLRPAWKLLFDETERRTAAQRLLNLVALWVPDGAAPSAVDDLDGIVAWLTDKIARREVKQVPLRKEENWCDSVAATALEFSETGLITTSLPQCSHYLHCPKCTGAFPELERQFQRFESTMIGQCHELLKVLGVCLERVFKEREGGDEFAWRAIVCGAGLAYFDSISEFSAALNEANRGHVAEPALHQILLSLSRDELHLLSFAEAASQPFIEIQWSLYDDDALVYLPTDGDLSDVPQGVVLLNAPEVGEWKRLMTGSDLRFSKQGRQGQDSTLSIDGDGLLVVLNSTAAYRSERWVRALQTEDRVESEIKPAGEDSRMHALMDRMTELCDRMASASAAQVPIIDALQSVVNKIESPSRQRAEESVRREFGDALYEGLMPMARNMAIAAEYCWLYTNTPNPSRIVADLAAAFEHQLREAVFLPFCETLRSLGVLNYPERPGSSSVRPRPGLPVQLAARGFEMPGLPTLLENGRITRTLTLGSMQKLLERPLPALTNFLAQQRISIQEMMKVLPEIREARNNAVHEGQPSLREEASQIRRRWLGKTEGFPNIFAVLMGDRSGRAAGGGQ